MNSSVDINWVTSKLINTKSTIVNQSLTICSRLDFCFVLSNGLFLVTFSTLKTMKMVNRKKATDPVLRNHLKSKKLAQMNWTWKFYWKSVEGKCLLAVFHGKQHQVCLFVCLFVCYSIHIQMESSHYLIEGNKFEWLYFDWWITLMYCVLWFTFIFIVLNSKGFDLKYISLEYRAVSFKFKRDLFIRFIIWSEQMHRPLIKFYSVGNFQLPPVIHLE